MPAWAANLIDLLQSRAALIRLEASQIIGDGVCRIVLIAICAFFGVVTWLLLMAASVGLLHTFAGLAWYWACLALGGIHLIAMIAMVRRIRAPRPPAFTHTRSEFLKDKEWLQHLQHPKSKR